MRLRIVLPTRVLLETTATKVVAMAENGSFCILPRHVDFLAGLVPGLLEYTQDGEERFAAVDEGLLVKQRDEVVVATRNGVVGGELGELRDLVRRAFTEQTEQERTARTAIARLESDFVRRFLEMQRGAR